MAILFPLNKIKFEFLMRPAIPLRREYFQKNDGDASVAMQHVAAEQVDLLLD
jgi:hypothetical protein